MWEVCFLISRVPHVQYLCACVCVFMTPCMHAAALPTGICSFRHIFTSSAFKGINIALAAVAGLNGWLGGKRGAECQMHSLHSSFLPSPVLSFMLWSGTTWGVQGYAVAGSPQRQDPEATAPACVLCLEEYTILFICIYISGSRCSSSLLPCHSPSIYEFAISNQRDQTEERIVMGCVADLKI